MKNIQTWDSLLIDTAGGLTEVTVLHIYASGRLKVRLNSGHITVIDPDCVAENLGYQPSDYDRVLRTLIKD